VGTGVSIGFDPSALNNCALEVDSSSPAKSGDGDVNSNRALLKCVYTEEEKLSLISESVNAFMDAIRGEHPEVVFPGRQGIYQERDRSLWSAFQA
jgi:hypothetical protein